MNDVSGGRPVSFSHVEAALALLDDEGRTGARSTVPVIGWNGGAPRLVLTSRTPSDVAAPGRAKPAANLFQYSLSIPGEVQLAEARCALAAELDADVEAVQPGLPGRATARWP